ncbi:MAG: gliding motility-associated C-terminal domain-containing protein [Saprospiraceae bacterium]
MFHPKSSTKRSILTILFPFLFVFFPLIIFSQTFNGQGGLAIPPGAPNQTQGITTSDATVTGVGVIGSCVEIEVLLNINHSWIGDIGLTLTGPNGEILDLSTGNGGSSDDYIDTEFLDGAVLFTGNTAPPYTGAYRPEGRAQTATAPFANTNPLGTFTFQNTYGGSNADGIWTLTIDDYVGLDVGILNSWSITFVGGGTPANPASSEACDTGGGLATFDLTTLDNTVNGGSGNAVSYWQDINATIPIANPTAYISGTGTVYATVAGGCANGNAAPITLTVTPATSPSLGSDEICENSLMYNLIFLQDPTFPIGTWSGIGVTGSNFNPTGLNGSIMLTYTPSGNCTLATTTFITVLPSTSPTLGTDVICENSGIYNLFLLQDPNFPTGTWSGTGVSGSTFNPTGLNGNITLTFTPSANCASESTTVITITPSVSPTLGTDEICENSGIYNLLLLQDPNFPTGTWSGAGVTGSTFDPTGQNGMVVLTFTSTANCASASTTFITVTPSTPPILGTDDICENSGSYNLFLLQDPNFPIGTWSGTGVTGSTFDPTGLNGNITLTFTPTGNCSSAGTTFITVTPLTSPNLGVDAICENSGIYNLLQLQDPNFPTGTWSGVGVIGSTFDPMGQSGTLVLTFTPSGNCTSAGTTFITVTPSTSPNLGTDAICANSGNYNLLLLQDPNFPIGTWSGAGVTGSTFDPTGQNGTVVLTFTPTGNCSSAGTTIITVTPLTSPNLGTDVICENSGNYNLLLLQDPNFPIGTWSGVGVIGSTFDPTGQNGMVVLTFMPSGNCSSASTTIITVIPSTSPTLGTDAICENSGVYNLMPLQDPNFPTGTWSGVGVTGSTFDPTGQNGMVVLTFTPSGNCSSASTTNVTITPSISPTLGTDEVCENSGNYDLQILQDPNFSTGIWSGVGVTGSTFDPTGQDGNIVLTFTPSGNCVSSSTTNIMVNSSPVATLSGTTNICEGETVNLVFDIQGTGLFNIIYQDDFGNQFPLNDISDGHLISVSPLVTTTYTIVSVTDGNTPTCNGIVMGEAIITVSAAPSVNNILTTCNGTNSAYTVSFEITGGDASSYQVTGGSGSVSGNIFTSDEIISGASYNFVVTDANDCSPVTVTGTFNCTCTTFAGTMNLTPIEICENETAIAVHNGDQILDANDLLQFVLHDGSGASLGTIFSINSIPEFIFQTGMQYGITYYISAIAGSDDGNGNIDLSDGCLSSSQGTPIVFYQIPTAEISGDLTICSGEDAFLTFTMNGSGFFNVTYLADNGMPITLENIPSGHTEMVNPLQTTVYTIESVSNNSNSICGGIGNGSATITVTIGGSPTLGTSTLCENNGLFDLTTLEDSNFPMGSWSGSGVSGNDFDPTSLSGAINLTFTPIGNCSQPANTIITVNSTTSPSLGIATLCGNNGLFDLTTLEDINFSGGVWSGDGVSGNEFDPTNLSGEITLTYTPIEDCTLPSNTTITIIEIPQATISGTASICEGSSSTLTFNFLENTFYDIIYQDDTGNQFPLNNISDGHTLNISPNSSTTYTLVSVTGTSALACEGIVMGSATITVNESPTINNIQTFCNALNTGYTVSFEIAGGDASSYQVIGGNGSISGSIFTSDEILSGMSYSLAVSDANGCVPVDVVGTFNCNCTTFSGIMDLTPLSICEGEEAVASHNSDEVFDGDDMLEFVLHDGNGTSLGNIFSTSNLPSFAFQLGMQYGETYYISAIVGNDLNGNVDVTDPCLSISQGTPVVFNSLPTATIMGDASICVGESSDLIFNMTGNGPFEITIDDGSPDPVVLSNILDGHVETFFPTTTTIYSIILATDASMPTCESIVMETATITVNESPSVSNIQTICNTLNTSYTVSFEINGGDASSYQVMGGSGSVSGNIFTSNEISSGMPYSFVVSDANGCAPVDVVGTFNCNCTTFSGTMDLTPLSICEGEEAVASHNSDEVFDGDDMLEFVLHDGNGTSLGTVFSTNNLPVFTFQVGMQYGATYYISAIVGNDLNGNVDVSDPCLSVSQGTPVVFNSLPTATISGDASICAGEPADLIFNMIGNGPFDIIYQLSDGSLIPLSNITNNHIEIVFPIDNETYTLVSIIDNGTSCGNISASSVDINVITTALSTTNIIEECDATNNSYTVSFEILGGVSNSYIITGGVGAIVGNTFTSGLIPSGTPYFFTIDDINGCTPFNVTGVFECECIGFDFSLAVTSGGNVFGVSCADAADGSIEVTNINGGVSPFVYEWSNNQTGASIANLTAGTYTVTITDNEGCSEVQSINITAPLPLTADLISNDISCFGETDGSLSIENVVGGTPPYIYAINNSSFGNNNIFTNLESGTYSIIIQDANGCEIEWSSTILEATEFQVSAGLDTVIELGQSIQLQAITNIFSIDSIYWNPSSWMDCNNCLNPILTPLNSQTYEVIVVNNDGCSAADQIMVLVEVNRDVYIPNVFTPNGDGNNDVFMVYGGENIVAINTLKIFDRWGALIFENNNFSPNDYTTGWDGSFKGELMNSAVFIYFAAVEFKDGTTEIFKGDITIKR